MCLAPLVLVGYLFGGSPLFDAPKPSIDGMLVDVQTCETGVGLHVRAAQSGLYSVGLQYGYTWELPQHFSLTMQPRAGLSYTDHTMIELPLKVQFELGAQLLLGYDRYRVGLDWWHLSNAGLKQPNYGVDTWALMVGYVDRKSVV